MKFISGRRMTFFAAGIGLGLGTTLAASQGVATLRDDFVSPPAEARPLVRWWWFGPAVEKSKLNQEMLQMKAGGFGGFEVATIYPLALDGQYPGLKNLKFLSPEYFEMLRFTAAKAHELDLRMDLTLGSGWPYGGPMIGREEAAQSIREEKAVKIQRGQTTAVAPDPARLVAALLGPIADATTSERTYETLPVEAGAARLPDDLRGATQVRFYQTTLAGLNQVKRPAFGAEGFVVDHYSASAIDKFISAIALPEIEACGANPPYSVFCDSLEIAGEGWTPDLPAEFRRRRGYDLLPLLPALFDVGFPRSAEIRADYARVLSEIFDDTFAARFTRLAHDHQTRFRLQAYGTPPTTLATCAQVDLAEGEGPRRDFLSPTRWTASANHLLGRAVTSSEAFTVLHSPVFMAAPVDIKAESNLQFLNGVNQLTLHGWPYTAPGVEYPGWRFYAAAVFNEKNPWWIVMPDITRYLARCSYLLRQGRPVNDVALYLPEEDAFADAAPANLQMVAGRASGLVNLKVNEYLLSIGDAGFDFDLVNATFLEHHSKVRRNLLQIGDGQYRIVVLPKVQRIPAAALQKLAEFAEQGGIVVAVGPAPDDCPGYKVTPQEQKAVHEISRRLFSGPDAKGILTSLEHLGATLQRVASPDARLGVTGALGFVHRHVDGAEIYFIANTSNQPVTTTGEFRVHGLQAEWWDPITGQMAAALVSKISDNVESVAVDLSPYESRFLVFAASSVMPARPRRSLIEDETLDLGKDWDVTFTNAAPEPNPAPAHFANLSAWSERPETRNFSGTATYRKKVDVSSAMLRPGGWQQLDFGRGKPDTEAGDVRGVWARFQPPVSDAATIYVNDRRAGALWSPPYGIDITGLLHPGENEIVVTVGNRAVNFMSDTVRHPLPDYRGLNASGDYGGTRFQPQDMDKIRVMPSGLLEPVRLRIWEPEKETR